MRLYSSGKVEHVFVCFCSGLRGGSMKTLFYDSIRGGEIYLHILFRLIRFALHLQQLHHAIGRNGSGLSDFGENNTEFFLRQSLRSTNVVQDPLHAFQNDLIVRSLCSGNDFTLETIRGLLCVTVVGENEVKLVTSFVSLEGIA
jgi:hypothetical protein